MADLSTGQRAGGESNEQTPERHQNDNDVSAESSDQPLSSNGYQLLDSKISEEQMLEGTEGNPNAMLFKFVQEEHVNELMNNIRHAWRNNKLIDVHISSEDKRLFAFHGVVLAGYSPDVFKKILTCGTMQWFNGILAPRDVSSEQLENLQLCLYEPQEFAQRIADVDQKKFMTEFAAFFGLEEIAVNAYLNSPYLLENLCNMFNERCLTFSLVKNRETQIPVHSVVIEAMSPYFQKQYPELPPDPLDMLYRDYSFPDFSSDAISQIIDFLYTAEITLSENTIHEIFLSSCLLQVLSVLNACCRYIQKTLNPANCIPLHRLSSECYKTCPDKRIQNTINLIEKFITDRFIEVIKTEYFRKLMTETEILVYLGRTNLNNAKESFITQEMVKWYMEDQPSRGKSLPRILASVATLMDPSGLMNSNVLVYKENKEKHLLSGILAKTIEQHNEKQSKEKQVDSKQMVGNAPHEEKSKFSEKETSRVKRSNEKQQKDEQKSIPEVKDSHHGAQAKYKEDPKSRFTEEQANQKEERDQQVADSHVEQKEEPKSQASAPLEQQSHHQNENNLNEQANKENNQQVADAPSKFVFNKEAKF